MRILVVSDTHGLAQQISRVLETEGEIDALIHCGDLMGQDDLVRQLRAGIPTYMVGGNCDWGSSLPRLIETQIEDIPILVTHGDRFGVGLGLGRLADEAKKRGVRACFFGHTHIPEVCTKEGILFLNPGSLVQPRQEGRKPTYLIVMIEGDRIDYRFGQLRDGTRDRVK